MAHVTVVIPTFNRAHSICDAIDSVLNQTIAPYEVVVVDDGSTDETVKLLEKYCEKIRVFRQENSGVSSARNRGIAEAKGDWIAFLDSDDIWYPERLEILERDLLNAPSEVVGHAGNLMIEHKLSMTDYFKFRGWKFPKGTAKLIEDPLIFTLSGVITSAVAIRKATAIEAKGFPENVRIYEDAYLYSELSTRGKWLFTSDRIALLRRLDEETKSLSSIETRYSLEASKSRVNFIENIYRKKLDNEQRKVVGRLLSGSYLILASAEESRGNRSEIKSLITSVKVHPNKLLAVIKVILVLTLRRSAYDRILKKRISRS